MNNYELFVSIVAILIAFGSFVIGCGTMRIVQNHNKLSVMPNIEIEFSFGYYSGEFNGFTATIKNNGLGTAIIDSIIFEIDGVSFSQADSVINKLVNELGENEQNGYLFLEKNGNKNVRSLAVGDSKEVLVFQSESGNTEKLGKLKELLDDNFKIIVFYESMYKKMMKESIVFNYEDYWLVLGSSHQ